MLLMHWLKSLPQVYWHSLACSVLRQLLSESFEKLYLMMFKLKRRARTVLEHCDSRHGISVPWSFSQAEFPAHLKPLSA